MRLYLVNQPLVCWPVEARDANAFDQTVIVKGGQTVRALSYRCKRITGRIPVWLGERMCFCDAQQLWQGVTLLRDQ